MYFATAPRHTVLAKAATKYPHGAVWDDYEDRNVAALVPSNDLLALHAAQLGLTQNPGQENKLPVRYLDTHQILFN